MFSSSVHDKIQRLGAEEEPQWHWQMKAQAVDLRQTKMLQTNHDGLQERNIQHMETWEANHDGPRGVHQDDISHKAPRLQWVWKSSEAKVYSEFSSFYWFCW